MWKDIVKFISHNFINGENIKISLLDIILVVIAVLVTQFILKAVQSFFRKKLSENEMKRFDSVYQVFKYVVYLFVIVFLLKEVGVNVGVFLTASAAIFVGLGFALQTFFQDIISGILIILDKSLHVGDVIEINDHVGEVKEIKLRTTVMITRNDRVMIIPNHKFMEDPLFNWTQNKSSNREKVTVGVAYGSDVKLVEKLLMEAAESVDRVLKTERINVTFDDFADSSLTFAIHFYVPNGLNAPGIQSEVRFKIYELFEANAISIAFPQLDLHLVSTPKDFVLNKRND
ncbi:mechanosensitive ion channel family protein [Flavobacterium agrisoli]|uniref:Mechanosensitive ion channel n=1 Tax=Flavobacterium agrisoli TaxID=2793066 RepID=A0A934UK43_9FLAO|nr:mechanosensitive ion channel domain-containing protein [Flavobacterium agrisoli]MBK0370184.1 mechanosensitive ion channel [Flavobacterium agrisoli]